MNDGTVSLCFPQFYGWNGVTLTTGTGLKVSVIERLSHFLSFCTRISGVYSFTHVLYQIRACTSPYSRGSQRDFVNLG